MPDLTALAAPGQRPDPWRPDTTHCIAYHLRTDAEADVLYRLLGLFAQLQLLPDTLQVQREREELQVQLRVQGLSRHHAGVLAEKLRSLVCVWQVDWRQLDHTPLTDTARAG